MKMKIEKYQNDNPKRWFFEIKKKRTNSVGSNQKAKTESSYRGSRIQITEKLFKVKDLKF